MASSSGRNASSAWTQEIRPVMGSRGAVRWSHCTWPNRRTDASRRMPSFFRNDSSSRRSLGQSGQRCQVLRIHVGLRFSDWTGCFFQYTAPEMERKERCVGKPFRIPPLCRITQDAHKKFGRKHNPAGTCMQAPRHGSFSIVGVVENMVFTEAVVSGTAGAIPELQVRIIASVRPHTLHL